MCHANNEKRKRHRTEGIELPNQEKKSERSEKRKLTSTWKYKGINISAASLIRYSGPFLKWTREELQQMDDRIRKHMTMYKGLHPRDHVDCMYQEKKEEEGSPSLKIVSIHRYKDSKTT